MFDKHPGKLLPLYRRVTHAMRKLSFVFFYFACLTMLAQQWQWAKKANNTTSGESVQKICADQSGNSYLLGVSTGGSTYGNTQLPAGYFMVKFDPSGSVVWAKTINITDPSGYHELFLYVDKMGYVYLYGRLYNSLQILNFSFTGYGEEDIFVIKLDPSGSSLWGKVFGGPSGDGPGQLVVDEAQNIYVTGSFANSISFDGHSLSASGDHFFLVKLDPHGQTRWATQADSGFSAGSTIRLDDHANVYLVAGYQYSYGSVMAKFDSSGNLLSFKAVWGMYDYVPAFAVSGSGNIYLLHNGGGHYEYEPILVRYDENMNAIWSKYIGADYGCYAMGNDVFLDTYDHVYVGGGIGSSYCSSDSVYFQGQLAYVGSGGVPALAMFDSLGNLSWVNTGSSTDYDAIGPMAKGHDDAIYVAGHFNYPGKAGFGDTLILKDTLVNDGNWQQIYVAKFKLSSDPLLVKKSIQPDLINVYPNPSRGVFTVKTNLSCPAKISVFDILGNYLLERSCDERADTQIDLSGRQGGVYFIELVAGNERIVKKIAVQ